MRGTARKIFGDEIADQVKDVWGFDEEGELRTMWRRTGHAGFWFFGGNLYVFPESKFPLLGKILSLEACLGSGHSRNMFQGSIALK